MATIHPYKGYLNTEFHIYAKGIKDVAYNVYALKNNDLKPIMDGIVTPNIPHSITLKYAGSYRINFSDGTSSVIMVEDGFKFGGGEKKSAFIFDKTPWAFIIMHDRTYFFNRETDESYIEPISPDSIEEISEEYVIFRNNNHTERTIYSLLDQRPILNISNIIYFNDEIILWKEDDELVLFSLKRREPVLRINYNQFTIDHENRRLIYANNLKILEVKLYDDFEVNDLYKWRGKFLAFINCFLSAICSYQNNIAHLQIVDFRPNKIVKELEINGYIASVNDQMLIDTDVRENAIRNFDIENSEFPEASIESIYNDITFYPCDWDVYYVLQTTTISKSKSHFTSAHLVTLRSIQTDLVQPLKQYTNKIIISDARFVLYNKYESFVKSKFYNAAVYREGGEIHVHKNMIILSLNKNVFTLSKNGYWDNRIEGDYDFSKFEKFGIVHNNETKEYRSFKYNIKGKDIRFFYYPEEYVILGNSIIYAGGNILFDKSDFHSFSKKPIGISPNHSLGIDIRDGKVYLITLHNQEETLREILNNQFDSSHYQQVLLSESATQILYRTENRTEVKDILTGEVTVFNNLSYVEHCNGIRPSFQLASSLQPRIINPITGQVLDCDLMKKYKFISPDGEYYAGALKDMYEEQYYRETNTIVNDDVFKDLVNSLTYPSKEKKDTPEYNNVTTRRILFVERHFHYINKEYPTLTHGKKDKDLWNKILIDSDDEYGVLYFVRRVIAVRGIAVIRRMSDSSEVAKIDLGLPLSYINYVSFSYDSRYVSLAGYRDFSHGLFLIYDLQKNKLICRINTNRAVWLTAFSSQGLFAAYTSNPNTIFFNDDFECDSKQEFEQHLISHRNFLSFSPDGSLIALSNQGYKSKYDIEGNINLNWGHQPSTFVEVRQGDKFQDTIVSYNDLSNCGIADISRPKSVASVAFSNDNKRLMMVGNDGVVIIRNLHFDENAVE